MQLQQQRFWGVVAAILGAMVFIYGAFHFPQVRAAQAWNAPLWLGIAGIALGGAMLVRGCQGIIHIEEST